MPTLLAANLSVSYPNKPRVLDNAVLDIQPGEIVGLVGQSGSGKSTLGLAMLGLLSSKNAAMDGELLFEGHDLTRCSEREWRRIRGKRLSMVFQGASSALNPALRLEDQFKEAWRAHAKSWPQGREHVCALLRSMELPGEREFLRRYPSQISIGQAQRVLIAMAVMHNPALVVADEPTSALDMVTQSEVLNLFKALRDRNGTAFLFISHDLVSVAAVCDRVCVLKQGSIVETGVTSHILESPQHPYTKALVGALPRLALAV